MATCLGVAACPGSTKQEPTTEGPGDSTTTTSAGGSDGTTADAPTTDGSTSTTGGAMARACDRYAAAARAGVEQYCPCAVEFGFDPDVATCEEGRDPDSDGYVACLCELEAAEPMHAAYVDCRTAAELAYHECMAPVTCEQYDTQPEWDCSGAFSGAYSACGKQFPAATVAIEGQCEDSPPFTCESGDVVPGTFICDGEADCADMSDEAETLCQF
ncbi:low-density lipoprotein receptor class A repeat-containing protein [Nannocystis bainbridge]|uniref:Low-density lipoprotein receptor class A repeat-containing protein n=1 Tax=Nannocystis bainbridge TaxID=2995303 RepID=A0ABT5DPN2_9BACT|nr:low-density lipoprotein receptor class A repeat-containing protein [Nannocystis bainbridge]MDC0715617.1 low-density lipoprotein receptor class A repeat-containing protein [Nannocystis bainbridge]